MHTLVRPGGSRREIVKRASSVESSKRAADCRTNRMINQSGSIWSYACRCWQMEANGLPGRFPNFKSRSPIRKKQHNPDWTLQIILRGIFPALTIDWRELRTDFAL